MILIDEGWKALDDDVFAARIRDWLKTLRKRNALVGFATQSARDALDSRIGHRAGRTDRDDAVHAQCPRARRGLLRWLRPDIEHELDVIRTLPTHSRCFLIRQPDASVVVAAGSFGHA